MVGSPTKPSSFPFGFTSIILKFLVLIDLALQDLFFKEQYVMYQLQNNHFNQCLEESIPRYLMENPNKYGEIST